MASSTDAFCAGIEPDEAALRYAVLLQQLPDIEVAVISNTNAVHVSWLDEHVAALAEFELVIMSNEVEYLKPDPEIFELALELLDVTPGDTIFVDDNAENVAAARLLGDPLVCACRLDDDTRDHRRLAAWKRNFNRDVEPFRVLNPGFS